MATLPFNAVLTKYSALNLHGWAVARLLRILLEAG
jgi:hypothetical protein